MMKTIIDYLDHEETGVIANALGAITPEKRHERIVKLHNTVHKLFYDNPLSTSFELRIDFDPKKVNTDAVEDCHRLVRIVLDDYKKHFEYIVMREWGQHGTGRLHYHGLIKQTSGGQTSMAKLRSYLKRIFGRRSDIKFITYPTSYIPYMLKRTIQEDNILYKEWFSSLLIKSVYMNIDEYRPQEIYNYEYLLNKRTKN
nr:putative rep [Cressdnaviricota sp.]